MLFAACLCLKSIVISHLQPLPSGILHPTGAYSTELLRLCSIFPETGLETASSWSVPLPSTALLPCGIGCRAPLGSASVWKLFNRGVSWQPRGTNLTRAPGQATPSSSLLVSCSVFQDFCDLRPKVGQGQAAPGQYLNWVSISRGKSCSLPDEVVSFSQDLPQCTLPWVWIWHRAHGTQTPERGGSGETVLAVKTAVKPIENCLLGQPWGVGMTAGQCITCPEEGRVSCQGVRKYPSGGCCRRGLSPHCYFFPHLHRCFLASLDAGGAMFHTLQWHSTGRSPLNQSRVRAGNRGK